MSHELSGKSGLCATCAHVRIVTTPRSRFVLCEKSREDERFARYPRLPVVVCAGHEPAGTGGSGGAAGPGSDPGEK